MHTFIPKGNITGMIIPAFIWERPVSLGAKVMYTVLCNYASTKDHCWPSLKTLSDKLSCSVNTAKKYLQELIADNLVFKKSEQYRSSVFYMLCPSGFQNTNFNKRQLNVSNADSNLSNFDNVPSNFDYINNLNKQNKETSHPLPPADLETYKTSSQHQKVSVGGVFPFAHDFLKAWEAYPKKEGKGLARMAFVKLHQEKLLPPLETLLKAIEHFTASDVWQKENGRFIPQMSNWLRGERWLDELSLHEKQAQIVIEEQEKLRAAQALRQAEEDKKRQQEHEKTEALRPQFNAFATKFVLPANSSPAFGRWLYLHGKGIAPTADDVPENYTADIGTFLKDYQRQCEVAKNTQVQASVHKIPYPQTAMPCLQKAV